jgi:GT2 family glycosyltransferase
MYRICAVVVTYKRREMLRHCLSALLRQTQPIDHIVVVDNASSDGTVEMVQQVFPNVAVLPLAENLGGAFGFHEGIRWALAHDADYIWAMDDDAVPLTDCLEQLCAQARPDCVAVPVLRDPGGLCYGLGVWNNRWVHVTPDVMAGKPIEGRPTFAFVGPLLPVQVVRKVGLPEKRFFIWFDDLQYSLRILDANYQIKHVPEAICVHPSRFIRKRRNPEPVWMLYYGVRNMTYTLVRDRRIPAEIFWHFSLQARAIAADTVYGPDRVARFKTRILAMVHGLCGKLGKRQAA